MCVILCSNQGHGILLVILNIEIKTIENFAPWMAWAEVHDDVLECCVCFIGDGGSGKTTYISRVAEGVFCREYVATTSSVYHTLTLKTNMGYSVGFKMIDTAGQEKNFGLKDVHYVNSHGAIIFFDKTSRITAKNIMTWMRGYQTVVKEGHIVVCGNKTDVRGSKADKKMVDEYLRGKVYDYCEISAKTGYNLAEPLLLIARSFTGHQNLIFVSDINVRPADINLEEHTDAQYAGDIERAAEMAPEE